jgi:hypothetical protein
MKNQEVKKWKVKGKNIENRGSTSSCEIPQRDWNDGKCSKEATVRQWSFIQIDN